MRKVCLEHVKTYDVLDRVYRYGTQQSGLFTDG
jgi:hypothetical protein